MSLSPYLFDEFFASHEESISPFLTPHSRKWGQNLSLKTALIAAVFLLAAFIFSFLDVKTSSLLLAFVFFLSGTPALIGSLEDLRNLEINIDTLMTVAAFLAIAIGSPMEGALLLVLFAISGSMEEAVSEKTKSSLRELHQLSPSLAYVINEEGLVLQKSLSEVVVGQKILVKAGEIIPLDGKVIEGYSTVNLVHLTGESLPVSKTIDDEVYAGARNLEGTLTVSVTKTSQDSTLALIINLITEASKAKPKLQKLLDRIGKPYASSVIGLSILFAVFLPFFFPLGYFGLEGSIYRSLAFLIAASPCALIIATPTAYLSAINACTKKGILLKGGIILDALSKCTLIAFDKTGTLTTGELTCTGVESETENSPYSLETALQVAASLERHAKHPIATAICHLAQNLPYSPVTQFRALAGKGVEGTVIIDGQKIHATLGHALFTNRAKKGETGFITTYLRLNDSLFSFKFIDTLRPNLRETLTALKKEGLKLVMLTGDLEENAKRLSEEVGIDFFAELSPEDKLKKISSMTEPLVMIGDGINDAPALARAHVGISMGQVGSRTAIDASDIVFLKDDLSLLPWLFKKAKKTKAIIKENLSLSLFVILFATTPALLGVVPLWVAVLLHEGGTLLVGLNSLRLLKK